MPTYIPNSRTQTDDQGVGDMRLLSQRIRLVAAQNPYMADNLSALTQMAMSPMGTEDLVATAGQHYSMILGDKFANQLRTLTPGAQRAITSRLAPGQQQALAQMGYQEPNRDEGSFLGTAASMIGKPLSVISHGVTAIPGVGEAAHATMETLNWVGQWPAHLYRTARTMDEGSQFAFLAGGALGLAAVALAVPTGGGSLMALGALGLGATIGGSGAAFASNPGDWIRAFNASWDGEKTFSLQSQRRAEEMLGDPRLTGAAHDLSALGIDVVKFAHEAAGHRSTDTNSQLGMVEKMAAGMAAPGSAQYKQAVSQMTSVLADPTFQQAVQELNNGKISPGRDVAGAIPFVDQGSTAYTLISGLTDAVYTVAVDPTLMLGLGHELYMAKRYTFDAAAALYEGADAASELSRFVYARKPVLRNYEHLAAAVENGSLEMLRQRAPKMEGLYGDLVSYRQGLKDSGELKGAFTADHAIEYLAKQVSFKPLLEGIGSVKSDAHGIQLVTTSFSREQFREFRGAIRSMVDGMADVSTEQRLERIAKIAAKHGGEGAVLANPVHELILDEMRKIAKTYGRDFEEITPIGLGDKIGEEGLISRPWKFYEGELNPNAYSTGRAFANKARTVPYIGRAVGKVGEAITAMSTMSITGKAFHIAGKEAPTEIRALSELGRYMGMPSYYRKAWADVILTADSAGARMDAIHGWFANMMKLTGIDATDEGRDLVSQYLKGERKLYGAGDSIVANGYKIHDGIYFNEQADMMVMPDLAEMRKAAISGHMAKLMGIADLPVVEAGMNKVWKPAVLLRVGFIPRAAGEELAAWMLRDGFGGLSQQFAARNIANLRTYRDLVERNNRALLEDVPLKLTKDEVHLLNGGRLSAIPAHIRPVARMFERTRWADPAMAHFEDYASWLHNTLSSGFHKEETVDKIFGGLANVDIKAIDKQLLDKGVEVSKMRTLDRVREAQRAGILPVRAPAMRRLNVADYADNILLGNEFSVRRMMLGGVDNKIIEGGMEWARMHATTVMREASARNASPIDRNYDPTQLYKEMKYDSKSGELRPVNMIRVKGQRRTLANGDRYYAHAYDESITRPMADPAFKRALNEHMLRVRSPNVDQETLGKYADLTHNLGMADEDIVGQPGSKGVGRIGRNILRELVGPDFSREHWDQMLVDLAKNENSAPIAQALQAYLPRYREPSIEDVLSALDDHKKTLIAGHKEQVAAHRAARDARLKGGPSKPYALPETPAETRKYYDDLNRVTQLIKGIETNVEPTVRWARNLPLDDRHFVASFINDQVVGGRESFWAKRKRLLSETPKPTTSEGAQAWLDDPANRATVARLTPGEAEPAVPDGTTRMYRGENPSVTTSRAPALASDPDAAAAEAQQYQGRYFSSDRSFAEGFANMDGPGGHILYVDIPSHEVARWGGFDTALNVEHADPNGKWLYDNIEEARQAIIDHSRTGVLNPNLHDAGFTKSLRPLVRDAEGQFVETQARDASVVLYDAPKLTDMTFEQVLATARNRELVSANRGVIEGILRNSDEATPLIANEALARELHHIDAAHAGVDVEVIPHSLRMPRKITNGRRYDNLYPHTESKVHGETQLWHMPKKIADKKLVPTPDALVDPANEWATLMTDNFTDLIRYHNGQTLRAKMRVGTPLEDGTETKVPLVYEWDNGNLRPIDDTEDIKLSKQDQLFDHMGNPIAYGDTNYFTEPQPTERLSRHRRRTKPNFSTDFISEEDKGQPIWRVLGPRMRDMQDDIHHATRWQRKPMTAAPSRGKYSKPIQSNDTIPLTRARPTDIDRVDANDLPANVIGEVLTNREVGKFENMVNWGFDRAIGGSLDAVVRRPMAFHAFIRRFIANQRSLQWTLDPELITKTSSLIRDYSAANHGVELNPERLAQAARDITVFHGDKTAAKWTIDEALAHLRGYEEGEFADLLTNTITASAGKKSVEARAANVAATHLARQDFAPVKAALSTGTTPTAFIKAIEASLPEDALRSVNALKSKAAREAIEANPLLKWIDNRGAWDNVVAMHTNLEHTKRLSGELAASAAIGDVVPFLDSHEFKTQFADYGKGFMPFWYAEENFMKRWARGIGEQGPALIRRAQLTYMGLKQAGIVRTDQAGQDWFVYPGSGLLVDAVQRISGMGALAQAGVMFQTPTDRLLPGLNNRFGAPSFNPLVTIPMDMVTKMFPDTQPIETAMLGDFVDGQGIKEMLIPAWARKLYSAFGDEEDKSPAFASAMMTAMAYAEAHDQGLPDNATPGQTQDYLDRIRKHARIVVLAQALGGFFTPGSPQEIAAGDSANVLGLGVDDPGRFLNAEYTKLVRSLGIEDGTAKFLELNPMAGPDDVAPPTIDGTRNPLAYTIPRSESKSGAPIPSSPDSIAFFHANENYFNEFPNAAPWLLPQSPNVGDRSQYAIDADMADELRKQRSPEEFFRAMKFKGASQEYFAVREIYGKQIDKANQAGDTATARELTARRDYELQVYRMAHPIFTEELQSSDGRAQRTRTLNELRSIVDDPQAPGADGTGATAKQFKAMRTALHLFDQYKTRLAVLGDDRSASGVAEVEHLKTQFTKYMGQLVDQSPELMSLWVSVLRPEASLD